MPGVKVAEPATGNGKRPRDEGPAIVGIEEVRRQATAARTISTRRDGTAEEMSPWMRGRCCDADVDAKYG